MSEIIMLPTQGMGNNTWSGIYTDKYCEHCKMEMLYLKDGSLVCPKINSKCPPHTTRYALALIPIENGEVNE
jgi:hypothetical protein